MTNFRIRIALWALLTLWTPALSWGQDATALLTGGLFSSGASASAGAPSFTLSGGQVSLATATSGATIRYTTDSSNPTATSGIVWTGTPFTVASLTTLKAIAYKTGLANSTVTQAAYTPNGPTIFLTTNPGRPYTPVRLTAGFSGPDITYQLRDSLGKPIPVSSGAVIGLKMRLVGTTGSLAVDKSGTGQGCSVLNANQGILKFSWAGASLTVPAAGTYEMQWIVDGVPYPLGDRISVIVQGAIN